MLIGLKTKWKTALEGYLRSGIIRLFRYLVLLMEGITLSLRAFGK